MCIRDRVCTVQHTDTTPQHSINEDRVIPLDSNKGIADMEFGDAHTDVYKRQIVIQLLAIAVPYFQKIQREGESGRRKINQYTRILTIAIFVFQAPSYVLNLKMQSGPSLNASLDWTFFIITSTIILAAGRMFILWLGERITDKGIGNGKMCIRDSNYGLYSTSGYYHW